ncbi:rhodanese-like domain-containing protein [Lysinibacillus odysseyi]|uniref:Rhodanese n=1 Tax=Lysinibacillus odysseyi 34hs-1 = NBRC 100172 TaxID=1220589 RepID=A0A0A3IUX1_9BACI|nr:rhodanese-like domain-containing protein [Lysinibacillus odysseyi]KGR87225.1 rhodanese [Lysinibacillus odysseyi 34hs-1 = NBRC 100172]
METLIIVAVVAVFVLWRMRTAKGIRSISAHQLKQELRDPSKLFIDVRTPAEFQTRNIKQFRNVPLGSDFSSLPKDKEIVVICRSGMRSAQACKQLKKMGYERVTNVRGGIGSY